MSVRLVDNSEKIKVALREQIAAGINAACQMWVDEAKSLCPVGTEPRDYEDAPHLRDTIRQTIAATANSLVGEVRVGTPRTFWARFVNFGTWKMAAQPFWTVAGLFVRGKYEWLLKSGFVQILRGASYGTSRMR